MKIRLHLLGLLAILLSPAAHAQDMADSISAINPADARDYVLEGTVVTVWDDSFLLSDGSGQVVVDIRPYDSFGLGLAGQDFVQVTGRPVDGKLRPLVISRSSGETIMFGGTDMLEPLAMDEVMENTRRYRLPIKPTTQPAAKPTETTPTTPGRGRLERTVNSIGPVFKENMTELERQNLQDSCNRRNELEAILKGDPGREDIKTELTRPNLAGRESCDRFASFVPSAQTASANASR